MFYRNQTQALFSHRKSHFLIRMIEKITQSIQPPYINARTSQNKPPFMLLKASKLIEDVWETAWTNALKFDTPGPIEMYCRNSRNTIHISMMSGSEIRCRSVIVGSPESHQNFFQIIAVTIVTTATTQNCEILEIALPFSNV
jgi:hypothetical protein